MFTGDLVIMHKAAQYQVGDVIAYEVDNKNVIHRIVGGSPAKGFLTQGDNKPEQDPWTPKPEDILGKQWLHLPGIGQKFLGLRSMQGIMGLTGLAVLLFMDDLVPPQEKRRKGKRMKIHPSAGSMPFQLPKPAWFAGLKGGARRRQIAAWLLPITLTLVGIGLVSLLLAVYSNLQPETRTKAATLVPYEHNAVFHYTVHTLPSPLFTGTEIGPIGPNTDLEAGLPPIITALAQSIDIDLNYVLTGLVQSEIQGTVTPVLQIEVGSEWKQNFPLGEPIPFSGPGVSTRISLPMEQLRAWTPAIEEQMGYGLSSYAVTITPNIAFSGTIDGKPVSDQFSPPFAMTFRTTQAQMETELARQESEIVETVVERENTLDLWKISLPIPGLQRASLLGTLIFLLPGCIMALLLYFWLRDDELFLIQMRYGGMLIAVENTDLFASRRIQVESIKDMARLAQQYGGVIFHKVMEGGTQQFYIPDGQILYTYVVEDKALEA